MQSFDADDLMHGMIVTHDGLECHHPVEFEYYSNPKIATALTSMLCACCDGSSGAARFVDHHLNLEWKSVLLLCLEFRAKGAFPPARTKGRNGVGDEHRAQRARLVASIAPQASREEVLALVVVGGAVASVAPGVDVPTSARPRGRNRKHIDEPLATRSRKLVHAARN